jgi:hypothetical protein
VFHLIIIPSIGGSKINVKNIITAVEYTPYLTDFFDESQSKVSVILDLSKSFSAQMQLPQASVFVSLLNSALS